MGQIPFFLTITGYFSNPDEVLGCVSLQTSHLCLLPGPSSPGHSGGRHEDSCDQEDVHVEGVLHTPVRQRLDLHGQLRGRQGRTGGVLCGMCVCVAMPVLVGMCISSVCAWVCHVCVWVCHVCVYISSSGNIFC